MASPVSQSDLDQCAAEPIQAPGAIQPHGFLLCSNVEGQITHASANSEALFHRPAQQILGLHLAELLTPRHAAQLQRLAEANSSAHAGRSPGPSATVDISGRLLQAQAHAGPQGGSIFELEPYEALDTRALFERLQQVLGRLRRCDELNHLCKEVTVEMHHLLEFERVTLYRFDEHWNGCVVAETKTGDLPSYHDLHFPASDIPAQARALYHLNSLRLISDAAYQPVPVLVAQQAEPNLDMSHCVLRSVSPVHREYLANMGVRASMSLSLFRRGRLWGLVSCSQSSPRCVPHDVRGAASLVGEFVSALVESKEDTADASHYLRLKSVQSALLQRMRQGNDIVGGLTGKNPSVLDTTCAQGAAIVFGDEVHLVGSTPSQSQVQALRHWVADQPESGFWHTNRLPTLYPPAMEFRDRGCGVIALPLTNAQNNWLFWFRPEVAQTIKWGGDPHKPTRVSPTTGRLEPRKSFELWKETVHLQALPWQDAELLSAKDLKNSVIDVLLQSSEELASLNQELERSNVELDSFAYAASHDLKEPLRGIHNYAALAQRDLQKQGGLGETEKRLQTVMQLTLRMEDLINSLLHYAQVGRVDLDIDQFPLGDLVRSCCEEMRTRLDEKHAEVEILDLPVVHAHAVLLREVVVNLVTNAIKYNDKSPPQITVGSRSDGTIFVRDNGIGIKEKNVGTIFKIFRRLHGRDKFGGGTGTGLTIAKRIVERHGGSIWVESTYGSGSTFYFTLGSEAPT